MPCICDLTYVGSVGSSGEDIEKAIAPFKEELDKTTRLLCWLCNLVENDDFHYQSFIKNEELMKWWDYHQQKDEERRRKIKEVALEKLTDEEKEVLGL